MGSAGRGRSRARSTQPNRGATRHRAVIAHLPHPSRHDALELLLRVVAVMLVGTAILGLLPLIVELAA